MDTSLLIITVGFAILCVAIVLLATANIDRHELDTMIGNRSTRSLEERLIELSQGHEELAASVYELKQTVQMILLRLK